MRLLILIMTLLSLFGFQSCGNEEEQFQLIELETTGVSLKLQNNAVSLYGDIPSAENELTFVAVGKNANLGFLYDFQIGDEVYHINKDEYDNPDHNVAVSGEWGCVELINSNPYTTKIVITENNSARDREFRLRFGGVYITAWVTIIQKGNVSNENVKWDNIVCNQLSSNELFIGNQYLGIQNWDCIGNPPQIYPSAVFPETTFAKSFDKEVNEAKRPISLYTDFSNPFVSTIKQPSGVAYQHFVKDLIKSEEYESNKQPHLHLYRLANISSVENLSKIFPDNGTLAKSLEDIVKQKVNAEHFQNWIVGEVVFKGFSVTMDAPGQKGLFENSNIQTKGLVYLRSMTYGATAYFIMGSNLPYDEVKTLLSTPSIVDNAKEKLSKSAIILISNSSIDQNAALSTSFEALNAFIEAPYTKGSYGYPIYCTGCYLDDNRFFHFNGLNE